MNEIRELAREIERLSVEPYYEAVKYHLREAEIHLLRAAIDFDMEMRHRNKPKDEDDEG